MIDRNWRDLIQPKQLECEEETDIYGKFVAEPFERGFGHTLGNSLRRVLLSSLRGAAITAVRLEGVLHEFSTIPGVKEEVAEIVMNLKGVRLRLHNPDPQELMLQVEGPREVVAADIKTNESIVIINPAHYIATLAKGAKINAHLIVKMGKGYVPADENKDEKLPVGTIPMDAIYSPVRKVNVSVSPARIGRLTAYDKLTLEIWTDGSVKPKDALAYASKILQEHTRVFIHFEERIQATAPESPQAQEKIKESLMRSIEDLDLSVRTENCLKTANIRTVGELVQRSDNDMLDLKNFGKKSLQELKEILGKMGLSFGMHPESLPPDVMKQVWGGAEGKE